MRPIKFRAWSKKGGYFVQPDSMHGDVALGNIYENPELIKN